MILHANTPPTGTPPASGRTDALAALVREALDAPRLTRDEIAARLDIPRGRLESYQYGARRMPDAVRRRLALVLSAHADELRRMAGELLALDEPATDHDAHEDSTHANDAE